MDPAGGAVGRHTGALERGEGRQWEGEEAWGGQCDNDLMPEDPTHLFAVQEGSNCDWL